MGKVKALPTKQRTLFAFMPKQNGQQPGAPEKVVKDTNNKPSGILEIGQKPSDDEDDIVSSSQPSGILEIGQKPTGDNVSPPRSPSALKIGQKLTHNEIDDVYLPHVLRGFEIGQKPTNDEIDDVYLSHSFSGTFDYCFKGLLFARQLASLPGSKITNSLLKTTLERPFTELASLMAKLVTPEVQAILNSTGQKATVEDFIPLKKSSVHRLFAGNGVYLVIITSESKDGTLIVRVYVGVSWGKSSTIQLRGTFHTTPYEEDESQISVLRKYLYAEDGKLRRNVKSIEWVTLCAATDGWSKETELLLQLLEFTLIAGLQAYNASEYRSLGKRFGFFQTNIFKGLNASPGLEGGLRTTEQQLLFSRMGGAAAVASRVKRNQPLNYPFFAAAKGDEAEKARMVSYQVDRFRQHTALQSAEKLRALFSPEGLGMRPSMAQARVRFRCEAQNVEFLHFINATEIGYEPCKLAFDKKEIIYIRFTLNSATNNINRLYKDHKIPLDLHCISLEYKSRDQGWMFTSSYQAVTPARIEQYRKLIRNAQTL